MVWQSVSLLLILACMTSCSLVPSSFEGAGESASQRVEPNSVGDLKIIIDSPEEVGGAGDTVKVSVEKTDDLRAIQVEIDGVDVGLISYLPFQAYINPNKFNKEIIIVRAKGSDHAGRLYVEEKAIRVQRSSTGAPGGDCRQDTGFDSCIFRKNPVAQNGAPISGGVQYGKDLSSVQVFGVRLQGMTDPNRLANEHITVNVTQGTLARPENGKWNFSYQNDRQDKKVGQVMAYYWLNEQIRFMTEKSGAFYASNKRMSVDAHDPSVVNNAYFSGNDIVMGIWNRGTNQEMALSAEVYLHEMGHANLYHAMNRSMGNLTQTCPSDQGCLGAIHEGQADIHSALMFPEDPTMAQSLTNTMAGWSDRNLSLGLTKSMSRYFSESQGEIHGMGSGYASILWSIYLDAAMNKSDYMKLFTMHLARIRGNSDFREAKTILMNISDTQFQGKYTQLIKSAFESRGVQ